MEKEKGLKLFGVRIEALLMEEDEEEVMRKSHSMANLVSCASAASHAGAGDSGYLSDGGLVQNSRTRGRQERKKGVPWTEEEHRTFLAGLEKLGKGDWRGISRNFVTTRTPTQVASHAQKYFLRQSNPNKKKRRSSLFDVGINDNATPPSTEIPAELSSKTVDVVAEKTNPQSKESNLACATSLIATPAVARVAEASQTLALSTNISSIPTFQSVSILGPSFKDHENTKLYRESATLAAAPNFLQLSLPTFSVQQPPKFLSVDNSDLELRIGPPQPHPLTTLPSPPGAGAIRVI